jgi:ketosteroid isomerase-like protein
MPDENVEIIRRSFEVFEATGEVPWELIDLDVEVRDFDLPDAVGEVFRGHEGYKRWIALWSTAWEEYALELQEIIDAGDRVIAVFGLRAKGRGSGVETLRENAAVFTVQSGKVTRCDDYGNTDGAFAAAGVPDLRNQA